MAFSTTRSTRAARWQFVRFLTIALLAASASQMILVDAVQAEPRSPNKTPVHAKPVAKAVKSVPAKQQVAPPADESAADELNEKWLKEHNERQTVAAKPGQPAPAAKPQPGKPETDDERVSSLPSMATPMGPGSRSVVRDSVKFVKAGTAAQALGPASGNQLAAYKELVKAFEGFSSSAAKVEMVQGKTVDGWQRTLYASIGEGKAKQSYWWFAPPDQPEGWFDDQGKRLGGSPLAEPKPDAVVSSPFGNRRFYGRAGAGFHNGIDFEGRVGDPIYASADGVITHQGWYYNYGRTVKISHADNFETLYAHMSRFAPGAGPGNQVRKGDLIGYVGSTGRSTGPHLHFSAILNGQFVDPAPYITQAGNGQLQAHSLVAFRQWQQEVRNAVERKRGDPEREAFRQSYSGNWSQNPFQHAPSDR